MAYDTSLHQFVLFGGSGAGSQAPFFSDTWAWNGHNWAQLSPAAGPPERYAFGMVYDKRAAGILIYGGLDLQ